MYKVLQWGSFCPSFLSQRQEDIRTANLLHILQEGETTHAADARGKQFLPVPASATVKEKKYSMTLVKDAKAVSMHVMYSDHYSEILYWGREIKVISEYRNGQIRIYNQGARGH